jgi:ElaB/YqjD/DUF883 family membrane-anchored ribosome-binding protein
MIKMAHSESTNDRGGPAAPRFEYRNFGELARKGPAAMVRAFERFVADQPGLCLGASVTAGILLGWWVKRR